MTFITSEDFDRFLSEGYPKPNIIIIDPKNYRISEDGTRVYIATFMGIVCYRDGIAMGEAMNLNDAIAWVDTNKEIEMWT